MPRTPVIKHKFAETQHVHYLSSLLSISSLQSTLPASTSLLLSAWFLRLTASNEVASSRRSIANHLTLDWLTRELDVLNALDVLYDAFGSLMCRLSSVLGNGTGSCWAMQPVDRVVRTLSWATEFTSATNTSTLADESIERWKSRQGSDIVFE